MNTAGEPLSATTHTGDVFDAPFVPPAMAADHPAPAGISAADASDAELTQLLARAREIVEKPRVNRLSIDPENLRQGLGQLVLTLVRLLHELLERQAILRIEGGALTDKQVEDVGYTLMRQAEEIERLTRELGLSTDDLNIDLGPIGRLF